MTLCYPCHVCALLGCAEAAAAAELATSAQAEARKRQERAEAAVAALKKKTDEEIATLREEIERITRDLAEAQENREIEKKKATAAAEALKKDLSKVSTQLAGQLPTRLRMDGTRSLVYPAVV